MKLFDMATWAAIVILVLGSSVVFLWFLRDARKILNGEGRTQRPPPTEAEGPDGPPTSDS